MAQTIHVVSHTHWDREWYRPFQIFRARLVDLVDALLDLLEAHPEYAAFHLDGQTAILEDYLEIRPEQESRLARHIREGRILIGPWYTQPDEFLVSGEALVRNLLRGRRIAQGYGACMDLGYLPDTFGHTGQMPQILAGFGFPAAIFFRGITADQVRSAFTWRGTDGTALLAIKLPDETAYSNFFYGLRSTLAAQGAIDWDVADRQLTQLRADSEASAVCEHLLWMDGVDHVYANPKTPSLIERANAIFADAQVIHSTLPVYVQAVRDADPDLVEQVGELRHANRAWRFQALLANVASSHIRIKQANHRCQNLLEKAAEPLSALAWLRGDTYPRSYLALAWEYLLQNHAHDSICGCSVDQVHREMNHRYDQVAQIGAVVQERALDFLAGQIDTSFVSQGDTALVVANPSRWARTETLVVDVPIASDDRRPLQFRDSTGREIRHQVLGITNRAPLRQPQFDVPSPRRRSVYHVALSGVELPPYSLTVLGVHTVVGPQRPVGTLFVGPRTMENAHLRATVEESGSLTLTHKPTGRTYRGLMVYEDSGDGGSGWQWIPPQVDQVKLSSGRPFELTRVQDGPLMAALQLTMHLRVPRGLDPTPYEADPARMRRTEETVDLPITTTLSLAADARHLDVAVEVDNRAQNHRLRVQFPTGITTDVCFADVAYDVIERTIAQPDSHDWLERQLGTYPHHSFVGVMDAEGGLAVLTAGTPEYEVIDDPQRTVAITLLRAFGRGAGEPHEYLDSQEPGPHAYRLALIPFAGSWQQADIVQASRTWSVAPTAWETPIESGPLPSGESLLRISGDSIDVTTVKLCESRASLLIRCVNLSDVAQTTTIAAAVPVSEAFRLDLAEERVAALPRNAQGSVRLELSPREIATIELTTPRTDEQG